MKEVTSRLELLPVEAYDEVEMDTRLDELPLDDIRISLERVDPLSCAPRGTHRGPD